MLLIRSLFCVRRSVSYFQPIIGQSRRWICQSKTLMNEETNDRNDNNITKRRPRLRRKKKPQILPGVLELKSEKAPDWNDFSKMSPLDFVNQGKWMIPKNWRQDKLMPEWKRQKFALAEKFQGEEWKPTKKLSRQEMDGLKMLKKELPDMTATDLANHFQVSPEAVRRILRSNWEPALDDEEKMYERWKKRGEKMKEVFKEKYGHTKKVIFSDDGRRAIPRFVEYKNSSSKDPKAIANKLKKKQQKKKITNKSKIQDMMF